MCFALVVPQDLDQEVDLGVDREVVDAVGRAEVGLTVRGRGVDLLVRPKARRLAVTTAAGRQAQRRVVLVRRRASVGRLRRVVVLCARRVVRRRKVTVDRRGRALEGLPREAAAGRGREAEATAANAKA